MSRRGESEISRSLGNYSKHGLAHHLHKPVGNGGSYGSENKNRSLNRRRRTNRSRDRVPTNSVRRRFRNHRDARRPDAFLESDRRAGENVGALRPDRSSRQIDRRRKHYQNSSHFRGRQSARRDTAQQSWRRHESLSLQIG